MRLAALGANLSWGGIFGSAHNLNRQKGLGSKSTEDRPPRGGCSEAFHVSYSQAALSRGLASSAQLRSEEVLGGHEDPKDVSGVSLHGSDLSSGSSSRTSRMPAELPGLVPGLSGSATIGEW